jgi:hypothetical protein
MAIALPGLTLATTLFAARASADSGDVCGADVHAWVARCEASAGVALRAARCPEGHVILGAHPSGAPAIDLEIARDRPDALRHSGGLSVSPVANLPEWSDAPPAWQRALDEVGACLDRDPSLSLAPVSAASAEPVEPGPPWRILPFAVAVIAGMVALGRRGRRLRDGLWLLGMGVLALALNLLLHPAAFFHPNGQGSLWIRFALGEPSAYGPGYHELFGFAAWLAPRSPDQAVIFAQALLGATMPPAVYALARSLGARRDAALVWAAFFLFEPALGRAVRSESYFAAGTSLMLLAGACLAEGSRGLRLRSIRLWVGTLVAALLLALSMRIHPLLWVPAPFLGLVPLAHRGPLRARVRVTAVTLAATCGVALLVDAPMILGVLHGALGHRWVPRVNAAKMLSNALKTARVPAVAYGVLALGTRRKSAFVPAGMAVLAIAALGGTAPLGSQMPWHTVAQFGLFAPAWIAATVSLTQRLVKSSAGARWLAVTLLVAGLLWCTTRWTLETRPSTDALEARWVATWRDELPEGASVFYLERAGLRVNDEPLFGVQGGAVARGLAVGDGPIPLPVGSYWLHDSLCSTTDGHAFCETIERASRFTPIARTEVPASPSSPGFDYTSASVELVLERVVVGEE